MLDTSRIRRDAPYRAAVEEVVGALRRLHTLPAWWRPVPLIPTKIRELGAYAFGRSSGSPFGIEFEERGTHHAATILHEVGHLIDHQYVGITGAWASYPAPHTSLIQWSDAVRRTMYWRQLDQFLRNPAAGGVFGELDELDLQRLSYLLDERELFARSYLQWAAMRGEVTSALAELHRARPVPTVLDDFPEQWAASDFIAVAEALDALFSTLNRTSTE